MTQYCHKSEFFSLGYIKHFTFLYAKSLQNLQMDLSIKIANFSCGFSTTVNGLVTRSEPTEINLIKDNLIQD